MTLRSNARVAGLAYLIYIAAAFPAMIVFGKAAAGNDVASQLAGIARHAPDVQTWPLVKVCKGTRLGFSLA